MKKNNLYKALAVMTVLAGFSSCSDDYLDTEPITNISSEQAVNTTKAAQMTVYGICRIMHTQYQEVSAPRGCNGEASYDQAINEIFGPDNTSFFNMGEFGRNWYTWSLMTNKLAAINDNAWAYCYLFVSRANDIIATIGSATGSEAERKWIEAQARTLRAHGYIKALQWFAPRWQDSNNGEAYAVVLRTEPGTGPAPLGTMNQVLGLIYSDLTTAISLYQESKMQRKNEWEPDLGVAYGLFARAAMIKNDWATAQDMAHNAQAGRSVMSASEFMSGFISSNNDYMWNNTGNDVYYSSYGSWFSCNGAYPSNWGRGFSINLDLYNQLDPNDIRRDVFFTPDKLEIIADMCASYAQQSKDPEEAQYYATLANAANAMTEDDFWKATNVSAGTMDCSTNNEILAAMCQEFILGYIWPNNPVAKTKATSYPYHYAGNGGWVLTSCQLGASFKMWSSGWNGSYGDSDYPYMRATEMVLTEAEAAYMAGDEKTAKAKLEEVNKKRIAGYACTSTGADLLNEIRICRRVELWGEGYNFTDFKRWNLPAEERAWKEGDPASGNTPANYASRHEPSACNGWRLAIPQSESDFNPGFDRNLLKYSE